MTTPEEDEAWRLIVDNYDETAVRDREHPGETSDAPEDQDAAPEGPDVAEELGTVESEHPETVRPDLTPPTPPAPFFEAVEPAAPQPVEPPEESARFVPPPPPPAPATPPGRRVAWASILCVPLLFFLAALTGRTMPPALAGALALGLVAAFVYLVATLPREPRDPWDDGSRV